MTPARAARPGVWDDRVMPEAGVPTSTRAFLWLLVVLAGFFGSAFLLLSPVALVQGAQWWLAVVVGLVGLGMVLWAVQMGRTLVGYRRALRAHTAAEAEFDAAAAEARARLGLPEDRDR